ncbi:hypothetical protein BsWGS_14575 [Bradybaena similaris]
MSSTFSTMSRESCPQQGWTFWPLTTNWTVRDVGRYVTDLGYRNYAKCFTENAITGKDLEKMDAFDLQRLGVSSMRDAMFLSAYFKRVTSTTMSSPVNPASSVNPVSPVNPARPPNVSYESGYRPNMEAYGHLKLPPLGDVNNMRLPYRDPGDRMYRYKLPVQSFHDHCMVLGRTDVWKMYNSKF